MPKLRFRNLPANVLDHLLTRGKLRQVPLRDIERLLAWKRSNPDVPDGLWVVDFGSFQLVGRDNLPLSFIEPGKPTVGTKLSPVVR